MQHCSTMYLQYCCYSSCGPPTKIHDQASDPRYCPPPPNFFGLRMFWFILKIVWSTLCFEVEHDDRRPADISADELRSLCTHTFYSRNRGGWTVLPPPQILSYGGPPREIIEVEAPVHSTQCSTCKYVLIERTPPTPCISYFYLVHTPGLNSRDPWIFDFFVHCSFAERERGPFCVCVRDFPATTASVHCG